MTITHAIRLTATSVGVVLGALLIAGCGDGDSTAAGGPTVSAVRLASTAPPAGSQQAADRTFVDPLRQRVTALGVRRLGQRFSCAVTPTGGPRIVVYVADRRTIAAGRKLLRDSKVAGGRVRVGYARRNQVSLTRISDALHHSQPQNAGTVIRIERTPTNTSACPRLQIRLAGGGDVPTSVKAWAEAAVRRYGSDRVIVAYDLEAGPA